MILTRTREHQPDSFRGKWYNYGALEHSLTCHSQLNWIHPNSITRENECREKKIREALEIKKTKYS